MVSGRSRRPRPATQCQGVQPLLRKRRGHGGNPMPKITKSYYLLADLPARWGCSLADIGGWALAGRLQIMMPIGPVKCGAEIVAGMVMISATDIARLFFGAQGRERVCRIHRILSDGSLDWGFITEPEQGIEVHLEDLLLVADDLIEFEQINELLVLGGRSVRRGGRGASYDWEGMLVDVLIEVITKGLPRTQEDFLKMMLDWFASESRDGDVPDASTVRKRFSRVWWRLQDKL